LFVSRTSLTKTTASQNCSMRGARREVTTVPKRTYGREAAMEPGQCACVMLQLRITPIGLTACRGDGARDTVKKPTRCCFLIVCGSPDGSRDPANDLPRRLSRVCPDASLTYARPQSCARHHAVPHGGPRRPCPSLSRWPHGTHLVQLVSPPGMPAM